MRSSSSISEARWLAVTLTITTLSAITISAYIFKRKFNALKSKIHELESSLKSSSDQCTSERRGRIRAQQLLRKELTQPKSENLNLTYYPMIPIGTIQSCFSTRHNTGIRYVTPEAEEGGEWLHVIPEGEGVVVGARGMTMRHSYQLQGKNRIPNSHRNERDPEAVQCRNGTPRQPLLVPLARACLVFNTSRVPPASLEGLSEYSHCWIIYVFHLNTNLEKMWKHPSKSGIKAKVKVPRLNGGRVGVFGTRSPHRPCPIGLTVAKVEAVQGDMVLLSGVDLVDGTPVLDVKPYIPFCDSIQEAAVPNWLMGDNLLSVASVSFSEEFTSSLENCWIMAEKKSLYASPDEFQSLVKQVLSWDIRSLSQRNRPHDAIPMKEKDQLSDDTSDVDEHQDETAIVHEREQNSLNSKEVVYHLFLEGLNVHYRITDDGNVIVEKVSTSTVFDKKINPCNYLTWKDRMQ